MIHGSVIAAAVLVAAAACRGLEPRLTGGARSIDELTARFVAAVSAGDTAAMHRLRVSAWEHNAIMWPELPASRLNHPVETAWRNVDARSVRDATLIVAEYAGDVYDVLGTSCRDTTDYASFRIHRDCRVTLRRGGRRFDAKLFGSVSKWTAASR